MRRPEARSAQIDRPDGVIRSFQVRVNSVEPSKSVLGRNLFAKHNDRADGLDEPEELGPEVTVVRGARSFPGRAEGLAGAGAGPNRSSVVPTCASQGVAPDTDPGEEMALDVSPEVVRINVTDASLIYVPRRDVAGRDEVPQPLGGIGINLVVVSAIH